MKKLPKQIFVVREDNENESFLYAHEHPNTLAEVGRRIKAGLYVLKEHIIITADSKVTIKK